MFTVSDIAKQVDVTPETVRHYVRIGLLSPERNPLNGYKIFNDDDIQRLLFIRQAKSLSFTLAEIRQILDCSVYGNSPCPQLRKIIEKRVEENRSKLENLTQLQERMETALEKWEGMPDDLSAAGTAFQFIKSVM